MAKKNNYNLYVYYSILLVCLLLLVVNLDNKLLIWVLFGATSLMIFKPLYIIPVYIISSLSSQYFVFYEGMGISRIIGFILILSGIIYTLRYGKIRGKKNIIYLLIISTFFLLSTIFSLTGSYQSFILYMQYFLILLFFIQLRNINLKVLTKLLVVSSFITIIVLVFTLRDSLVLLQSDRLKAGEMVDINRFAMMIAQLSAIVFSSILIYKKNRLYQILSLAIVFITIYMIILTGSRSSLIGILMAIILSSLYVLRNRPRKFIIPLILVVVFSYVFINHIDSLGIPIIDRFSIQNVQDSGGAGRSKAWRIFIPHVLSNKPFFGYGIGAENVYALGANINTGIALAAHNFLIDMFIQIGLIGMIILLSYFVFVAKNIIKCLGQDIIFVPILILLQALFNGVGETVFPEKLFWNGIALSWLYINNLRSLKTYI